MFGEGRTLLCKAVESPDNEAVDGGFEGFAGEVQRANETEGVSGLLQAPLGRAAELPQPRLDQSKEALNSVDVDSLCRNVPLPVDHDPVVVLQLTVRLQPISPEFSQLLGEVFSLRYHRGEITAVVDLVFPTNHPQHVAARRDERHLVAVASLPA